MANDSLVASKKANNNEFYTQYGDIETEMNAYIEFNHDVFRNKTILCPCDDPEWSNFTKYFASRFNDLGLKKLICTSYAKSAGNLRTTQYERESNKYDVNLHKTHGKIFILEHDTDCSGHIDMNDLEWDYLEGDGDFRSEEVTRLRDEADIIITNPPFNTLFHEFFAWIMIAKKQFVIIGSKNAITYKDVFPFIKNDVIWLGNGFNKGNAFFTIPEGSDTSQYANGVYNEKTNTVKFRNCNWYTNIDHGKRHEPIPLMTMAENERYNKKLQKNMEKNGYDCCYPKYDNYDAIEVKYTEAIPSDWNGLMGVPISFLDRYCPEQFEILGLDDHRVSWLGHGPAINGKTLYRRLIIKRRK